MHAVLGAAGPSLESVQDKRKTLYFDLKNAQIKILSFLTYLLRQFTGIIRPHQVHLIAVLAICIQQAQLLSMQEFAVTLWG